MVVARSRVLGSWDALTLLPSRYASITHDQIKAVAAKYFSPDRRSVATLLPEAGEQSESESESGTAAA